MNIFSNSYMKIMNIFGKSGNEAMFQNKDADLNSLTYAVNLSELTSYLMNAYRIDGLPEEIDQSLMWSLLVNYGSLVMFYDHIDFRFRVLPFKNSGTYKNYNKWFKPTKVNAIDYNGMTKDIVTVGMITEQEINKGIMEGEIVYISNTSRFMIDFNTTMFYYAQKITDIDRTMDIRRNYHKAPVMFSGDEKERSTFQTWFNDITENKTFFVNTSDFVSNLGVHPMDSPYINDKLQGERSTYVNQFLLSIGVTVNNQEDKKERLITSEVEAVDEQVYINRRNILSSLNECLKAFNDRFSQFEFDLQARYVGDNFSENELVEELEEILQVGGEDNDIDL